MKRAFSFAPAVLVIVAALLFPLRAQQVPAAVGTLSIDQLVEIKHPSAPIWSPDGRHVVFVWDRAGVSKVFVIDSSGAATPRELADAGSALNGAFWSRDGKALMVSRGGDLWRVPIDGSPAAAVWTTPAFESNIAPSPDASRVAFVRSVQGGQVAQGGQGRQGGRGGRGGQGAGAAELWTRSLADGGETLVLRADAGGIGGVAWSPDGQSLIYTSGGDSIRHEQTPAYSGSKIIYTINENVPGQTFVVSASGGAAKQIGAGGGFGGRRWIDARHFIVDRTSPDFKRRTSSSVDIGTGETRVLHEDAEEKFWSMTGDANG